jgi:hypothetical protein
MCKLNEFPTVRNWSEESIGIPQLHSFSLASIFETRTLFSYLRHRLNNSAARPWILQWLENAKCVWLQDIWCVDLYHANLAVNSPSLPPALPPIPSNFKTSAPPSALTLRRAQLHIRGYFLAIHPGLCTPHQRRCRDSTSIHERTCGVNARCVFPSCFSHIIVQVTPP